MFILHTLYITHPRYLVDVTHTPQLRHQI